MRYLLTILIFIILSANCLAQNESHAIKFGVDKHFLMINEDVVSINVPNDFGGRGCLSEGLILNSTVDSVFCNVDSKVAAAFDLAGNMAILLKDTSETYYSFSNLANTNYTKGQVVKKGDFLGIALATEDNKLFECIFKIIDNKGLEFDEDKILRLLKKQETGYGK